MTFPYLGSGLAGLYALILLCPYEFSVFCLKMTTRLRSRLCCLPSVLDSTELVARLFVCLLIGAVEPVLVGEVVAG